MAKKVNPEDARRQAIEKAESVTAPKPFDPTSLLSAGSGSAAAEAARQSILAQGGTKANAAASARYTGQAYDYYASQKAITDAAAAAEAAEKERLRKAAEDAETARRRAAILGGPAIAPTVSPTGNISTAGQSVPTVKVDTKITEEEILEEDMLMPERKSIMDTLTARFTQYGLQGLAAKIKQLAIDGANEATITFALTETDEYKQRFKANEVRLAKGLRVLSPSEYINVEDTYRQVLRAYGLRQFDTDDYVSQFISNDISPTELSNRVVTAVQRVQNADPAVSRTLRDYYGIGQTDMVAYVLDPEQQYQKIERQVAAAEIGTAARVQGLEAGVSVAEQLAAQGITAAQAQKGYSTIADILPSASKLSDIYGTSLDRYGQEEAEQEVFNQLASAQRKRQRLTEREIGTFSGRSGLSGSALRESRTGQI